MGKTTKGLHNKDVSDESKSQKTKLENKTGRALEQHLDSF